MERFSITGFKNYSYVEGQFSKEFIKNSRSVKIFETDEKIRVAVSESSDVENLKRLYFGKELILTKVSDGEFSEFVGNIVECEGDRSSSNNGGGISERFSLESISSSSPVVNIINGICLEAVRKNASDIHISKEEKSVRVRFRMDGVLETVKKLDGGSFDSIITRLKVMAGLNVAENRLPQDGSLRLTLEGKNIDFRASFLPASGGTSVVLRLFDGNKKMMSLEKLGFSKRTLSAVKKIPGMKSGLVLVSGPTGSGKTTTLHSVINAMDREHLKIITIEDPVEKKLEGVEQIAVNEAIGLTFENILRRVLRQDPDVIMVGEIRDCETAALAVRAALTGHLVLSTVHTKDSVGVVKRLINLGVESYMVAGVLKMSLAQRLVRKKEKGREAVSEVFEVDEKLSGLIEKNAAESELKKALAEQGFVSMKLDGKEKMRLGVTNRAEIEKELGEACA